MEKLSGIRTSNTPGPLVLVFGQIHGNEPAGVLAYQELLNELDARPSGQGIKKGTIALINGNANAARLGVRFVERDLNRMWKEELVRKVQSTPFDLLGAEEKELFENVRITEQLLHSCQPESLCVVDIHTTTADGGRFILLNDEPDSDQLAETTGFTMIHGMLHFLEGTTLHYFDNQRFGLPTASVAFEAGQHHDPHSVEASLFLLKRILSALGMLPDELLPSESTFPLSKHDQSPGDLRLVYRHPVLPEDHFVMLPGFHNFQPVRQNQPLAHDRSGTILCPADGYMLMPLYQKRGSDGFFIIQETAQ